jgi:hypothetical protein
MNILVWYLIILDRNHKSRFVLSIELPISAIVISYPDPINYLCSTNI